MFQKPGRTRRHDLGEFMSSIENVTKYSLPALSVQIDRLASFGLFEKAGIKESEARAAIIDCESKNDFLFTFNPSVLQAADVIPLIKQSGKAGFIVEDLLDVESFITIPEVEIPNSSIYFVKGLDRGDAFSNWSPNEALPNLLKNGASPLITLEGLIWTLQVPEILERNYCFMTIGSRKFKPSGLLDPRVPALWISNGTGRDGVDRRNAPKLGWCWAGNRHTWLGIASAQTRSANFSGL
jgi:hypothetical protein